MSDAVSGAEKGCRYTYMYASLRIRGSAEWERREDTCISSIRNEMTV
jgi:hypothetical protein